MRIKKAIAVTIQRRKTHSPIARNTVPTIAKAAIGRGWEAPGLGGNAAAAGAVSGLKSVRNAAMIISSWLSSGAKA
jgi:hypothetical protein